MLLDSQLLFSDAQAVTAAAASTNYVDLMVARDIGVGYPLYLFIAVDVAMTDSGSNSVLTVHGYFDSATTFTPDLDQVLLSVPAISAIGAIFYARISPALSTRYRYLQLYYDPIGSDLTAGTFTAGICAGIQKNVPYADNITIS